MNFLALIPITNLKSRKIDLPYVEIPEDSIIDFSYVEVPNNFVSFFQEITPDGQILSERPRNICRVEFDSEPDTSELYGFSGLVKSKLDGPYLKSESRVHTGLRYIGVSDDFYIFKLPVAHPGHEHFRGCSGAPIIDTHGKTVALVSNCPDKTNLILGISLKRYKVAIDITYGDLEKNR